MTADHEIVRFACPACRSENLVEGPGHVRCRDCESDYEVRDGIPVFIRSTAPVRRDAKPRAEFWDEGWKMRSAAWTTLERDALLALRERFVAGLRKEAYPSVTDIGPELVGGKRFLNVGCGGGDEGLLFAGYGARYTGVDLSFHAANFTTRLIAKAGFEGRAVCAEAEHLPIATDSVDFVYSNGVLHHTPDTQAALADIHRVLRPGGQAMIGLYPTWSLHFMTYRLKAMLAGRVSGKSYAVWLNANTELEWKTAGRENQWTTTVTRRGFATKLCRVGFADVAIRQTYFQLKELPVAGKLIRRFLPAGVGDARGFRFGGILMATARKPPRS